MFSAELKKGSSEMLILSLLEARPRHGKSRFPHHSNLRPNCSCLGAFA